MQQSIRNFAVIAHIDHGKTTLCDRLRYIARDGRNCVLNLIDLDTPNVIGIYASGAILAPVEQGLPGPCAWPA